MIQLTQKNSKKKDNPEKDSKIIKTLQEAENYLREIGEWNSVYNMDRQVILNWANFLKNKGITN